MTLLLAAVGATGAALFELTVGTYLEIGGAQPHFVLVLGIVLAVSTLLLLFTWRLFFRMSGDFAEEL